MSLVEKLRSLSPMARRLVIMRFCGHVGMLACYFIGILGTLTYSLGGTALSTTFSVGLINLATVIGNFVGGAMLDSLGYRELTSKAIVSHTIGGIAAGMVAHWTYVLVMLL